MTKEEIAEIVRKQRKFFDKGKTRDVEFRIAHLKKLRKYLKDNESEIAAALKEDLDKHPFESYMTEIGLIIGEIRYFLTYLKKLALPKRVKTPIIQFPSVSITKPVPYGVTLIMSTWNYPLMLSIIPLIDSVAAGNTVVLKPSAYSPATSKVIAKMCAEVFEDGYVKVILGGREENQHLLDEKFDYIFFTGSQNVGKLVAEKAAKTLTPVTLELGGKSPCIVDKTANIKITARRIVFGKFINCGQTCVAPDYIFCDPEIKDKLVENIKAEVNRQYGGNYLTYPSYGRIVNERHFDRLASLLIPEKVVYGGKYEKSILKFEPTVMDGVSWDDDVMKEEIFGPILPVLTYDTLEGAVKKINSMEKPLALYHFSTNKKNIEYVSEIAAFGGGCINDTMVHMTSPFSGFGGVGESGMGAYHGATGFETFSHRKSILKKSNLIDLRPRYQPYTLINELITRFYMEKR
ncbi:MAG TPA: aldehyde dehydrogenase [Clostridiales bacterium]|nr:aldehyde dehydrogenase [Clostridiales bacterium]